MTILTDNITSIYGDIGRKWLCDFDSIVADLARKWDLMDLKPFDDLTLSCFQNDVPIVLKIVIRCENLEKEAQTLRFFENHGAVKLIDSAKGALLLQCVIQGNSLSKYFSDWEDESIWITANVIQKLHLVNRISDDFFRIEDLPGELYEKYKIPDHYIRKAQCIEEHLRKTTTKWVVMRGDLHHDNIVNDRNEWNAIDPTGVIGDPVYEVASFMINPIDKI